MTAEQEARRVAERLGGALERMGIGVTSVRVETPGNGQPDAVRVGVMSAGDANALAEVVESDILTRALAKQSVERILAIVGARGEV